MAEILPKEPPVMHTRGYQQELLQESLHRNIVIALDTGSGKTHIAMLRMKHDVEQQTKKICWFLAPTVALIEQQRDVIASAIPVPVGLISGASEPDQWRDADLWAKMLASHRIMVSTPQVLLDALRHGYVNLGLHVSLLIFDEAHHAARKHPYNEIMKAFYMALPPRKDGEQQEFVRPAVLGLTASPIYGSNNVETAFRTIETNLDCVIRSSRLNRDELATFVHRPIFKHILYPPVDYGDLLPSRNLIALHGIFQRMDIEDDPYVVSLRSQLAKLQPGEQRNRVDQKLSKTLLKQETFTHKGLRDLARTATDLCYELGYWAADWYIWKVLDQVKSQQTIHTGIMASWQSKEKGYLLHLVSQIPLTPISFDQQDITAGLSPKVRVLISCLKAEEHSVRVQGDSYSGIIFATRRAAVVALAEILSHLPALQERFRVGCLLGTSNTAQRRDFLDITRDFMKESATQTLKDFKIGDKNLVVATAVAEEGLDIQACGNVIRFNPPDNMVSWAQSRGRARRQKSTYIVLFGNDPTTLSKVLEWEQTEKEMVALYTDSSREQEEGEVGEMDDHIQFQVESTGALLTLDSAMGHLHHFCAVLPHSGHSSLLPIFDLDPPEMEEGWHSLDPQPGVRPYQGPWGATGILPRQVPTELRKYSTSCVYPSKRSARNHAAFFLYHQLYQQGLLNDNLLPLTSVIEPDEDGAVKLLVQEVEQRAGLADVPIQMDPWSVAKGEESWWYNELRIGDLPPLFMFTRCPLPSFEPDVLPTLHVPGKGAVQVMIRSTEVELDEGSAVAESIQYTRRMFASLYSARMEPGKTDFCYAFLPMEESATDAHWRDRRIWQEKRLAALGHSRLETPDRINAEALAKEYAHPLDIALVRSNEKYDKYLQFIGWHYGPIPEEIEEELQDKYDGFPDFELTFPLLYVQPFPKRANFLIPLDSAESGLSHEQPYLLHPKFATIDMLSLEDVQYASQIPSVLRWLSVAITVHDMRNTLFADTPSLSAIPFSLLKSAITAPVSQDVANYQRLETLGDTVLKFVTSIQLFSQYPLWHEGYLSRRKDHAVNNNQLAKQAIRLGLERWIIRDRFVPRKWRPRYADESTLQKRQQQQKQIKEVDKDTEGETNRDADADEVDADANSKGSGEQQQPVRKKKKQTQQLSTKMLADVVESLIGAAYEHGGFDLGVETIRLFGLGLPQWNNIQDSVEIALTRVEHVNNLPPQLALVEGMLDYKFSRPLLLVEALTHATYTGDIVETVSYERLEFLGDAALDMIVTDFLYHAEGKNYGPGHMHIRKESLVNSHLLAYICMNASAVVDATMPAWTKQDGVFLTCDSQRIHLHQCMLHSSPLILDDLNVTFARYEKNGDAIRNALAKDSIYPWAALTSLQAPKFISDMLESLLGAVFLDSHGSLDAVRGVLRNLGYMDLMERIVSEEVDVLHPVSRFAIWAAKNDLKWEIKTEKANGDISCVVLIDDEEQFRATEKYRGKMSQNEVRFAAAEGAVRRLNVIQQEEPEDADDMEWGDVPEYIV